jgi:RNA ligase (TIGR02306 family)
MTIMKLATIEKIHSVQPHPNPEVLKLEVGKIKEWPVVVQKGQYKDGDLVVFIQIDSIVPETPYFEFMRRQKFKVWNAKFKGAPSQGLVCSLSIMPERTGFDGDGNEREIILQEGDDVTEVLGVTKYEKPLDVSVMGDAVGGFPTNLVPITDEDNLLNYSATLNEFMGKECYVSIKADGSSMTVIHQNGQVRICSRRLEQKEGTGFWRIAEVYDLPNKLRKLGKDLAIQAEACGGKIQGNPMGLAKPSMFVFNIRDLTTGKWYDWNQTKELCASLDIPTVKLLVEPFIFNETHTVSYLQNLANIAQYVTANFETKRGEGIVLRPTTPTYSTVLGKSLSVKILNQEYKQ